MQRSLIFVTVKVDLLLTDGFVLTEYAGVVDLLRLANRIALKPFFHLA